MQALLLWLVGAEFGLVLSLIGYIFRTVPKLRADLKGMSISYEREKERADDLAAIKRDADQAAAIGLAVAKALGKLPPESG